MGADQMVAEIKDINLSYMMLAQQMLRADKAAAIYRLGISQDVAGIVENLTAGQLLKMAASSMLLCRFRFDDRLIVDLLTSHSKDRAMSQSHAAILMAGQPAEAMA
jgi:flagellar transcriptional activator FlhD